MSSTITPNMNLIIPGVGTESGPTYAEDINASLTLIDQHTHAAGSGVPITPDALNISSDLTFQSNNATNLRSVRFTPQSAALALPADLGCMYEAGVDLYYNDGAGNQIRLTQSGSIVGTAGSITGLPSGTASAAYAAGTFIWQSATSTSATMDFGSAILRNNTANSRGLTLSPPNAMASDYGLSLPSLPVSQKIMTLDSSGVMAAPYTVDGTTIEIATNVIQVKDNGITTAKILDSNVTTAKIADSAITTAKIADANVTKAKLSAVGQQISTSSGSFTATNNSLVEVTNLSVTITGTGRPIMLMLIGEPGQTSYFGAASSGGVVPSASLAFFRGVTDLNLYLVRSSVVNTEIQVPVSSASYLDVPGAGTFTYSVWVVANTVGTTVQVNGARLVAYEL